MNKGVRCDAFHVVAASHGTQMQSDICPPCRTLVEWPSPSVYGDGHADGEVLAHRLVVRVCCRATLDGAGGSDRKFVHFRWYWCSKWSS